MSTRRLVVALALALLPAATAPGQSVPNTLLVIADDVGVAGITCYGLGSNPPPTPNIDALAARGVLFANAQACPQCSPTRASILTGRHGFRTGIGRALSPMTPGLDASEVLLPEILSPAGIRTALIGKWHLGSDLGALTPTEEGFGSFTGTIDGSIGDYYAWPKVENGQQGTCTTYATTDLVDEALAFVANTPEPWFLVLAFHAGHSPYQWPPANLHTQAGPSPANNSPIPAYKAMVEAMDTELGRLFATMPAATLANTNVVFVGDNGTESAVVEPPFDPARSKGTVYQGGVHVPLIVAGPSVGDAPRIEYGLAHAVDLFATLAALQGVDARAAVPAEVALDAEDLGPLLGAEAQPPVREYSYSAYFSGTVPMTLAGDGEVIRDARYELVRQVGISGLVGEEMFDLVDDRWETTDLLLQPLSAGAATAYQDLWRELARLRGYSWSRDYGAGCSGAGLSPTLHGVTPPAIGTTLTMRVQGLDHTVTATFGALGLGNTSWSGLPLPLDLTPYGMTGCSLWIEPGPIRPLARFFQSATWHEPLPNDPQLVGTGLFAQAFALVPNANPAGALATAAIEMVVGAN